MPIMPVPFPVPMPVPMPVPVPMVPVKLALPPIVAFLLVVGKVRLCTMERVLEVKLELDVMAIDEDEEGEGSPGQV